MTLADRIIAHALERDCDFIIGGERPYLLRWWLIPRNKVFNIYVHKFLRSDDDRAHHSHPWLFNFSWHLRDGYIEHTILAGGLLLRTHRKAGEWKFRWGAAPHRVELIEAAGGGLEPCWTLFVTGPRVREWGFYCMERGWIPWQRFTAPEDIGAVGKGCDA